MNQKKKLEQHAADQFLAMGIEQELKTLSAIHVAGTAYTPESLADLFRRRIDSVNAVDVARATLRAALDERARVDRQARAAAAALRVLVFAMFGVHSRQAAACGFKHRARRKLTPEENVAAARKRWTTRVARRAAATTKPASPAPPKGQA